MAVAHPPQNRAPARFTRPHAGHRRPASACPWPPLTRSVIVVVRPPADLTRTLSGLPGRRRPPRSAQRGAGIDRRDGVAVEPDRVEPGQEDDPGPGVRPEGGGELRDE